MQRTHTIAQDGTLALLESLVEKLDSLTLIFAQVLRNVGTHAHTSLRVDLKRLLRKEWKSSELSAS